MNKREILLKINNYLFIATAVSLVIACIFAATVESNLCHIIAWITFAILALINTNLDSYFHYSNLDLVNPKKQYISIAFALEIFYWILFVLILFVSWLELSNFIVKLILYISVVITAAVSDFFASLANDNYRRGSKIFFIIFYLVNIVAICVTKL